MQESSVEFSLLSTIGNGMLEANYYVSDYLRSKCSELENMLTDLHEAFNKRVDFLPEVRTILLKIEDVSKKFFFNKPFSSLSQSSTF